MFSGGNDRTRCRTPMNGQSGETTMGKSINVKEILRTFYPLLVLIAAIEVLLWAHWNSLVFTAIGWDNPKYSHGYLVPMFAAVLLWLRRDERQEIVRPVAMAGGVLLGVGLLLCVLPFVAEDFAMWLGNAFGKTVPEAIGVSCGVAGAFLLIQPRIEFSAVPLADRWIGFGIVVAAEALRMFATYRSMTTPELFSFVPAIAGIFIMTGGLRIMRWAGWSIVFLVFMLPLPGSLDKHLSGNLQGVATGASTFLLQTMGIQASHQGNDIFVGADESHMNVAEACSGLRMLTIFGALSFAVALLCERPLWQRVVIVASSIPIALIVNIVRITMTGVLYAMLPGNHEDLRHWGHDMWGWVMMPMALGLMFIEFKILTNLIIEDEEDLAVPMAFSPPVTKPKLEKPAGSVIRPAPANSGTGNSGTGNGGSGNGGPAGGAASGSSPRRPPREHAQN
jgi:exosortase